MFVEYWYMGCIDASTSADVGAGADLGMGGVANGAEMELGLGQAAMHCFGMVDIDIKNFAVDIENFAVDIDIDIDATPVATNTMNSPEVPTGAIDRLTYSSGWSNR